MGVNGEGWREERGEGGGASRGEGGSSGAAIAPLQLTLPFTPPKLQMRPPLPPGTLLSPSAEQPGVEVVGPGAVADAGSGSGGSGSGSAPAIAPLRARLFLAPRAGGPQPPRAALLPNIRAARGPLASPTDATPAPPRALAEQDFLTPPPRRARENE